MGAIDTVEHRDSSLNDEMAQRGRMGIEQGIAMIKGHPVDTAVVGSPNASAHQNGPGNSLQGWESGINETNTDATYCIDTIESKKHSGLQTSQQSSADGGDTG
ncbi:hypothetical protein DFH09DRAFT_1321152 [Mycena vulgaris]|nr:hypothetical protein DFH09DRAFT_1321152 [Mycena vulgaris]